jgi:hypothetical protein
LWVRRRRCCDGKETPLQGWRGGDEEDIGGCCWRPVCADEGSSVVTVLMREIVACGRLKREDLSAASWKAVPSMAERRHGAWLVCCGLKRWWGWLCGPFCGWRMGACPMCAAAADFYRWRRRASRLGEERI